jgi:hypothetical protein
MNNVRQEVVWYFNCTDTSRIYESIKSWLADDWRVHTCLERQGDVLVIYEKEVENECE